MKQETEKNQSVEKLKRQVILLESPSKEEINAYPSSNTNYKAKSLCKISSMNSHIPILAKDIEDDSSISQTEISDTNDEIVKVNYPNKNQKLNKKCNHKNNPPKTKYLKNQNCKQASIISKGKSKKNLSLLNFTTKTNSKFSEFKTKNEINPSSSDLSSKLSNNKFKSNPKQKISAMIKTKLENSDSLNINKTSRKIMSRGKFESWKSKYEEKQKGFSISKQIEERENKLQTYELFHISPRNKLLANKSIQRLQDKSDEQKTTLILRQRKSLLELSFSPFQRSNSNSVISENQSFMKKTKSSICKEIELQRYLSPKQKQFKNKAKCSLNKFIVFNQKRIRSNKLHNSELVINKSKKNIFDQLLIQYKKKTVNVPTETINLLEVKRNTQPTQRTLKISNKYEGNLNDLRNLKKSNDNLSIHIYKKDPKKFEEVGSLKNDASIKQEKFNKFKSPRLSAKNLLSISQKISLMSNYHEQTLQSSPQEI